MKIEKKKRTADENHFESDSRLIDLRLRCSGDSRIFFLIVILNWYDTQYYTLFQKRKKNLKHFVFVTFAYSLCVWMNFKGQITQK